MIIHMRGLTNTCDCRLFLKRWSEHSFLYSSFASPTTSSFSSLLSHPDGSVPFSLESIMEGLFGESRFGQILPAFGFVGVMNASATGDGRRRKSLRGGATGATESVEGSLRYTEGCLLDVGGNSELSSVLSARANPTSSKCISVFLVFVVTWER